MDDIGTPVNDWVVELDFYPIDERIKLKAARIAQNAFILVQNSIKWGEN